MECSVCDGVHIKLLKKVHIILAYEENMLDNNAMKALAWVSDNRWPPEPASPGVLTCVKALMTCIRRMRQ